MHVRVYVACTCMYVCMLHVHACTCVCCMYMHVCVCFECRALCRKKILPITHVLVDTWMLTVKPVYKLLNVWWPEMDYMRHHFHSLSRLNWQYLWFWKTFFAPSFFYPSTTRPPIFLPIHIHFYPSKWWVDGSLHKPNVACMCVTVREHSHCVLDSPVSV